MKKMFIIILLFILPVFSHAVEETLNIGIVDGLWFSDNIFFVGDEVFLNSAFFNNSDFDITGRVIFYNNEKKFFTKNIKVEQNDLYYIKIPFIAKEGEQKFSAEISEVYKVKPNGEEEKVLAKNKITILGQTFISVDIDTDGDDIGNKIDEDDDGDGYSDEIENKEGSDPLNKNSTPKNKDGEEKKDINDETITESILDISKNIIKEGNELREEIKSTLEEKIDLIKLNNNDGIILKESGKGKDYSGQQLNTESSEKTKLQTGGNAQDDKINTPKKKNTDSKEGNNYYLYFLEFWHSIFSSTFWSWLFFIIIIYILYRILKKILLGWWGRKDDY